MLAILSCHVDLSILFLSSLIKLTVSIFKTELFCLKIVNCYRKPEIFVHLFKYPDL